MTQRKLAIFVEGQTEKIFLENLIGEIAGVKNISFRRTVVTGNTLTILRQESEPPENPASPYLVLLADCQNDERVKTVVLYQRPYLERANFSLILGLRDLHPNPLSSLQRITSKLKYGVPTSGVATHILLAVAEIEAWFLQDQNHYRQIDPALDSTTFKARFGFDPATESAESVQEPAALLHKIYGSVGKAYRKDRKRVERTVSALDIAQVYLTLPNRLPHLRDLIAHIDGFLKAESTLA